MTKLNLGFLASHGGSNMQAIIDNVRAGKLDANLCAMITNNSNSGAMQRAVNCSVPAYHISESTHGESATDDIISIFKEHHVDTVVLAGYMKMISPKIIEAFCGRVLNIHPALLPKFGGQGMYGMNVHRAVISSGETVSGATVHLIDSEYDRGRILIQGKVPVLQTYTAEQLAEKVLKVEHRIYTEALILISQGKIII